MGGNAVSFRPTVTPKPTPADVARADLLRSAQTLEAALRAFMDNARVYMRTADEEELPDEATKTLAPIIAKTASLVVPNLHQKRDEIIYAAENPDWVVSSKTTGPDLIHKNGEGVRELKTSRALRKEGYHVNFSFAFQPRKPNESRETLVKRISKSFDDKVGPGGFAVFRIVNATQDLVVEYKLGNEFLKWYATEYDYKPKSRAFNFGCSRCKDCGAWHRLERLQEYSNKTPLLELDALPDKRIVFETVARDCGVKNAWQ